MIQDKYELPVSLGASQTYSWECVVRRLRSVHMVIWVHKLSTTFMAKDLSCSVGNYLEEKSWSKRKGKKFYTYQPFVKQSNITGKSISLREE